MYIVKLVNMGQVWMLRGTTWTSQMERADKFADVVSAQAGLERAKKFMKPALRKLATVEAVA